MALPRLQFATFDALPIGAPERAAALKGEASQIEWLWQSKFLDSIHLKY